jgi:hypothetical protein
MPAPTLSAAISQYGPVAYLLSVGADGPHTSQVSVELRGHLITCAIGASAARNIASAPLVSLLWPPREPGGYAMIVNGIATETTAADGGVKAEIALTKSVLHRAGPRPLGSDGPCTSDCRQIARGA